MYCEAVLGARDNCHTRRYIYRYDQTLCIRPGSVVLVPAKGEKKFALVRAENIEFPNDPAVGADTVQDILPDRDNGMSLSSKQARKFMIAVLDDYRDGILSGEMFREIADTFLAGYSDVCGSDGQLLTVTDLWRSAAETACSDEKSADDALAFQRMPADLESLMRYSCRCSRETPHYKTDPIEDTAEYLRLEPKIDRLIREQIGKPFGMGYCHLYWRTKQQILKEHYGIDRKSPAKLNPEWSFD